MKNCIYLVLICFWVLRTGPTAFAQGSTCPAPYEEKNGIVVIETENLSLPSGWRKATSAGGFTGSGYIEWTGAENFSRTGVGLIETTVRINRTGKYIFQWRNRVGRGTSLTEHNDTWLRFPDASNFYGEKGTRRVYPYGSGKSPNPNGAGGDGWFKVYFNAGVWDWAWASWVSDRDPMQVVVEFNSPGVYKLQVSARSAAHLIDRLVLVHSSLSVASAHNAAETRCTSGSTPTNQPPLVANPIADRTATVGSPFSFSFPTNTFSDPNGDALSYRATLASGAALPAWLTFSPASRSFSGVPTAPTTLTVRVTASDGQGGQVSDDFVIRVAAAPTPASTYRVNAGGGSYTTSDGKVYSADSYASGGSTFSRSGDITNTTQDALYQTERYGNFSYNFPVANGTYTVVLHFAEIYASGSNQRKFNVNIEGQRKLTEYDIAARAGGSWRAVQESFEVSVSDGTLNVQFQNGSVNNAKVCAIEVVGAGSGLALPYRTNAGGGSFTTSDGKVYSADSYASGGSTFSRSGDITNTTQDALYQTERYGNFSYNFPVSNGTYTVVLHFAEIYASGSNQRKFNVNIEGQRKLTEYDIA
ncbi:malectin domain-containing carbohydrate-binding protein, partial [Larkinella insperata]